MNGITAPGCSLAGQPRVLSVRRGLSGQAKRRRVLRAEPNSAPAPQGEYFKNAAPLDIGDTVIFRSFARCKEIGPSLDLSREQVLEVQLEALKHNDQPRYDHGVEVLYRFANFDPFSRSRYFGRSFDLGQFERFRRIMHTPYNKPLINHTSATMLGALEISEHLWRARVHVVGDNARDEGVFEWTLSQRLGGCYDGYYFTESLIREGNEWTFLPAH